jgi:hypothetical protein
MNMYGQVIVAVKEKPVSLYPENGWHGAVIFNSRFLCLQLTKV